MVGLNAPADQKIGSGQPCFIVAEAGVNHDGSVERAHELINAAERAGANAVKFQSFAAQQVVTKSAPKAEYQLRTTESTESQYEMLRRLELSPQEQSELMAHCADKDIIFMSSPFDKESVDLLDDLGLFAFKVGSGEITNLPLLTHVARKGKPIILSTGMSTLSEVETAVHTIELEGVHDIVLLQCVSNYPADPADVNLRAMKTMQQAFNLPVGYSDHTLGIEVALAAVALGACMIEKHFTLDCSLPGPDHQASLEPDGLRELVSGIRTVETALGDGRKRPAVSEANTANIARRSLVAMTEIPAGTVLTSEMITSKRPGTGLPPGAADCIIGRRANVQIMSGTVIKLEMLSEI